MIGLGVRTDGLQKTLSIVLIVDLAYGLVFGELTAHFNLVLNKFGGKRCLLKDCTRPWCVHHIVC